MGHYKNGIETKAALYQSSRECFYEKGYFDTTVRDIVDRANSKSGLFFYHFESKEAAAVLVFREYVDTVSNLVRQALGSALEGCDLLTDDMLNYRGFCHGLFINPNVARFYLEISTTPSYLEQNFRLKEYYYHRLHSPQVILEKHWNNQEAENAFISLTAGMEIQLCRDICSGRLQADQAVDLLLNTYYSLLVSNKKHVAHCVKQTKEIYSRIQWEVQEAFVPRILRRYDDP